MALRSLRIQVTTTPPNRRNENLSRRASARLPSLKALTNEEARSNAVSHRPDHRPRAGRGQNAVALARLFDEGVEAARTSKWDVAFDRFGRSYELAPRLKTLFNLAGAQVQTGRLVDSSESYRRILRETNDGRYEGYRKDARDILTKLEKRTPFATLRVLGLSPGDEVRLNGTPFPAAGLGESMPINPGAHTIDVIRDGNQNRLTSLHTR